MYATRYDIDLNQDLVALGHENGEVTLWKLSTGEMLGRMSENRNRISRIRINPAQPQVAVLRRPKVQDSSADQESFLTLWNIGDE
jgi:hypothetical protein